jgi:hypothetical protein
VDLGKPEKAPKFKVKFDRATLKTQLFGLHQLGAALSHTPQVAITMPQADALGESLADICEHYGLTASKEVMLWISLGATCAGIYGPKIVPAMLKAKATASKPKPPATPLRPVPNTGTVDTSQQPAMNQEGLDIMSPTRMYGAPDGGMKFG